MPSSPWHGSLLLLTVLAIPHSGLGQENTISAQNPPPCSAAKVLVMRSRGLLHDVNERGFAFQGMFVYDYSKPLVADKDSGSGYGRYSFDLSASLDGKKVFGLPGSAGFIRLKHHLNTFGATYDGSAQLYSNIDASSRTLLYEMWFEQRLLSDKLRFKGGKIDANTEFAVVQNAGDFLNSSMGYSPTIVSFPTYPEPKLGASAFVKLPRRASAGLGVFQTPRMGTLSIIEPGISWNVGRDEHPGRISLGYWRLDGKTLERFDGGQASGTQGFYSVIEQSAWKQAQSERRLSTFLQLGWAEGNISPFTHHIGGGAVLQAPFHRRSQDSIGAAATWVRFSSHPEAGFTLPNELILEAYYKASLQKHVAIVADFQYLHNPGGMRENGDCPVLTPRLVIDF